MNILFVTAEATPFVKTGGLADVSGALPKALVKEGHDCRVTMPYYGQIPWTFREKMTKIAEFWVDIGWKHEYVGVMYLEHAGVKFYFLENDTYFNRPGLYGQDDDAERFIFFSKAATMLSKVIGFRVDVIHSNDWHSALVNVFVNDYRTGDSFYDNVRTVFTIHNLKYQGQFGVDQFYWTNLVGYYMSDYDLKFYDTINFVKGAIVHANAVNTVSNTYAQEIQYPFFGEGLDSVIRAYSSKLSGIVNGIDYDDWNPKTDPFLPFHYDLKSLDNKKKNKAALQEKYGLPVREDVPVIGMVTRFTEMKGLELVRYILEEFLQGDVQLVVLGTGDHEYEEMFRYFSWRYPDKCSAHIYFSNPESHEIYGGSDLFLMPSVSEPCGISQMIAMRYGSVPIVREAGGLKDTVPPYNAVDKTGAGFTFANINAHELLYTMKEACDVYQNVKTDYAMLQKNGMMEKLDWEYSSKKYIELYESLF